VPPGTVPGINLPSGVAPVLADLGSLLSATGIFPQLSAAINTFVSGVEEQLQTIKEGLQYRKEYDFAGDDTARHRHPANLPDLRRHQRR
jgi:hypothetical protein